MYLEAQTAIQNHHYFWVGGWVIEWCERIENKAISTFNSVEVEVKAEFGKIMKIFNRLLN